MIDDGTCDSYSEALDLFSNLLSGNGVGGTERGTGCCLIFTSHIPWRDTLDRIGLRVALERLNITDPLDLLIFQIKVQKVELRKDDEDVSDLLEKVLDNNPLNLRQFGSLLDGMDGPTVMKTIKSQLHDHRQRTKDLPPDNISDTVTMNALVDVHAKTSPADKDGAVRIFEMMVKEYGLKPDTVTMGSLFVQSI